MGAAITTKSEKGQRIIDFLSKELNLPEMIIGFELHIRLDECIMVKNLDFYVTDENKDIYLGKIDE